jgi:hypothetical protein
MLEEAEPMKTTLIAEIPIPVITSPKIHLGVRPLVSVACALRHSGRIHAALLRSSRANRHLNPILNVPTTVPEFGTAEIDPSGQKKPLSSGDEHVAEPCF